MPGRVSHGDIERRYLNRYSRHKIDYYRTCHLTESFVHRAELVLFITSGDHPDLRERTTIPAIPEEGKWGQKVLFILNKIDLKSPKSWNEIVIF